MKDKKSNYRIVHKKWFFRGKKREEYYVQQKIFFRLFWDTWGDAYLPTVFGSRKKAKRAIKNHQNNTNI